MGHQIEQLKEEISAKDQVLIFPSIRFGFLHFFADWYCKRTEYCIYAYTMYNTSHINMFILMYNTLYVNFPT